MKKLLGRVTGRRFAVMLAGIVLLAMGISLFKLSLMGNDPSSAMVMAIVVWNLAATPGSVSSIGKSSC